MLDTPHHETKNMPSLFGTQDNAPIEISDPLDINAACNTPTSCKAPSTEPKARTPSATSCPLSIVLTVLFALNCCEESSLFFDNASLGKHLALRVRSPQLSRTDLY